MDRSKHYYDDKYEYCNFGCIYEDSVGFCTIENDELCSIRVPKDAKYYGCLSVINHLPKDLIPDKYYGNIMKEKYGIK